MAPQGDVEVAALGLLPGGATEYPWACGPPEQMRIVAVVTPAQAGIYVSPEEAAFPPFGKLRAGFSGE